MQKYEQPIRGEMPAVALGENYSHRVWSRLGKHMLKILHLHFGDIY